MINRSGYPGKCLRSSFNGAVLCSLVFLATLPIAAQDAVFHISPQQSSVKFTLTDVLHTVRGTFKVASGDLRLDPMTKRISGKIVVDARSGESGSGMRDRKMHRDVLASDKFPEIVFRADRIDGGVSLQGKSSMQVHGIFSIHGSDHELTVPADVDVESDTWSAVLHFDVPYAKWGMKNPSTLFLKVGDTVQIDVMAVGSVEWK